MFGYTNRLKVIMLVEQHAIEMHGIAKLARLANRCTGRFMLYLTQLQTNPVLVGIDYILTRSKEKEQQTG